MTKLHRKPVSKIPSMREWLKHINLATKPVYLLSMAGVVSITSATLTWTVLDHVSAQVPDKYDIVATANDSDSLLAIELQHIQNRIAALEAATLSSTEDVMSDDTQSLLNIKNSIATSDPSNLQSLSMLELYQEQLEKENELLQELETQLAEAKKDYYDSIKANTGGTDLMVAYSNAEMDYNDALAQLDTANMKFSNAESNWKMTQQSIAPYEEAVENAKINVENATPAYEIAIHRKKERENAQRAYEEAENRWKSLQAKIYSYIGDPNSADYQALQEAAAQAKIDWQAAGEQTNLLPKHNTNDIITYETYVAALKIAEDDLANAKVTYTYDEHQSDYEATNSALQQAKKISSEKESVYKKAKKKYDDYLSASGSMNAAANLKAAIYQDVGSQYSMQQNIVAELKQSVLEAQAQVNAEKNALDTETKSLANQFETIKSAILRKLQKELEASQ